MESRDFRSRPSQNLTFITIMKEILEAVLTDASIRNTDDIKALAEERAEFLTWE